MTQDSIHPFTKAQSIEELIRQANSPTEVMSYLMDDREWRNAEEVQRFASQIQDQWNTTPRPELFEHSPKEVAHLLHELPRYEHIPLDAVDLSAHEDTIREAPLFHNWYGLLQYIASTEVGVTATGNINRKALTDLKQSLKLPPQFTKRDLDWIHNELDWPELFTLRHCAQFADLLRCYKKTWRLTKKGNSLLARNNRSEIYVTLFDTWFNQLNWSSEGRQMRSVLEPLQPYRYFILSALARSTVQPLLFSDFVEKLCRDYFRCSEDIDLFTLRLEIHYPLISALERLGLIAVTHRKEKDALFESPHTLQCTPLCTALVKALSSQR